MDKYKGISLEKKCFKNKHKNERHHIDVKNIFLIKKLFITSSAKDPSSNLPHVPNPFWDYKFTPHPFHFFHTPFTFLLSILSLSS
jgi:hypothetical protein